MEAVSMDKGMQQAATRTSLLILYVRDVRDRQGRKRQITVRSWSTVQDVKNKLQEAIGIPPRSQRLYYGPLLTSGGDLPNYRSLADLGIYKDNETLLLDIKDGAGAGTNSADPVPSLYSLVSTATKDVCVSPSVLDSTPRLLRQIVQQARRALALGLKPEFALDGSGGTYFLHNAQKARIAVFKPADEEPYAPNNPRGYLRQPGQPSSFREGLAPGEACIREFAAYMLDHKSFGNVPMTTLAEARHPSFNFNGSRLKLTEGGASVGLHSIAHSSAPASALEKKVGSFQEYVKCDCTMDDISPSKLSTDAVHRIAILDIRLLNADRNGANLLCRRKRDMSGFELIPIDHGFCLRSVADVSWMDWCWLDWPQMKKPLSEASKRYVLSLDIESDAKMLKDKLNLCQKAIDLFRVSNACLQYGVRAGLSMYDIATMCCRNDDMGEIPSNLEVLFSMASDLAESAVKNGKWHHSTSAQALAEQLSPSMRPLSLKARLGGSASAIFTTELIDIGKGSANPEKGVPSMIQSTASDSSSDNGDGDADECEEWAATLVEEKLDRSNDLMSSQRRLSLADFNGRDDDNDSPLSSSPPGFWHVRPGSPVSVRSSDDAFGHLGSEIDSQVSSGGSVQGDDSSHSNKSPPQNSSGISALSMALKGDISDSKKKQTKVAFVDPLDGNSGSAFQLPSPLAKRKRKAGFIVRSQSYTALSDVSTHTPAPTNSQCRREYFFKFIDILLQREIAAVDKASK